MRKRIMTTVVSLTMVAVVTACGSVEEGQGVTAEVTTTIAKQQSEGEILNKETISEETTIEETTEETTVEVGDFILLNGLLIIGTDNGMSTFTQTVNPDDVMQVIIKEGVTFIGEESFADYDKMVDISIPNTVTTIGEDAFRNCDSLTNVVLPDSITTIEEGTFAACDKLVSVTLPNGITSIPKRMFTNTGLKEVVIPESVIVIGERAFSYCDDLEGVWIPSSVTKITYNEVFSCSKNVIIYGDVGSAAEKYANQWKIEFRQK